MGNKPVKLNILKKEMYCLDWTNDLFAQGLKLITRSLQHHFHVILDLDLK